MAETIDSTNPIIAAVLQDKGVQDAVGKAVLKEATGSSSSGWVVGTSKPASARVEENTNDFGELTDEVKAQQLEVSLEVFHEMESWAAKMRIGMILISIFLILVSLSNIFVSTSTETGFLAIYTCFFGFLLCCYEIAFKRVALLIVTNFGFLYNPKGRMLFLAFVGIMSFQLSLMGKVVFGMLCGAGAVYSYVSCKYPQYGLYMRKLHFYGPDGSAAAPATELSPTTQFQSVNQSENV